MTNLEFLRTCDVETLACTLVCTSYKVSEDYYFDGEDEYPYENYEEGYVTTDGQFFYSQDAAVAHEIKWLNQTINK